MRAKACFVMVVALFWSASVFSQAPQQAPPIDVKNFATGNDLYRLCSEGRVEGRNNFCTGYVEGVSDAVDLVNTLTAHGMYPRVCLPPAEQKVAVEQVRDIVVQWLTAHPERRHQDAAGEALWALMTAFPCK